jgi:hypothetical protein
MFPVIADWRNQMDINLGGIASQFASQVKVGNTGYTGSDALNLLNDPGGTLSKTWMDALSKATGVPESKVSSAVKFATNPNLNTGLDLAKSTGIGGSGLSSALNFAANPNFGTGLELANSLSPNLISSATGGLLNSTGLGTALNLLSQPLSANSVVQAGATMAFGPVGGFLAGQITSAFTATTIPDSVKNQSKSVAENYLNPSNQSSSSISAAQKYAENIVNSKTDDATKACALDDFANRCEDMQKSTTDTSLQEAYKKLAAGIKSGISQPSAMFKGKISDASKIEQAFSDFKKTAL